MSKMENVTKLLGVEFEEEFIAKYPSGETVRCKFHKNSFYTSGTIILWERNSYVFLDLLSGRCEIYKLPWKAELNEEYYTPFPASPVRYQLMTNNGSKQDDKWYKDGLMCKTQEQAEEIAKAMIKVAREMQGFEDENL